ncbi:hypothetical protein D0Z00_003954 [Geotrichum galactomycetum]|uniref:Uncharacterized protein n=1 Tax=Geotrichum galactomycetum TaxID=27317 RepID=A0ACB6V031_9ASCO|nr:hypothetical protein D0Z00_003954 [Geotrichum candidum]
MPDISPSHFDFAFQTSSKAPTESILKLKKSLDHADSLEDLHSAIVEVRAQREALANTLDKHVSANQLAQSQGLRRLNLLRAQLGSALSQSHELTSTLSSASFVASGLSSRVRRIDLEQSRVREALDYVNNVIELKSSVQGAQAAIDTRDWDRAAWYISKARGLPPALITGKFAKAMVPTAEFPDYPEDTLKEASKSLGAIFLREFNKAAQEKDMETLTRYFKLFPLIGEEKEGLQVYAKFICGIITAQSRTRIQSRHEGANNMSLFYGLAMTRLFENIAAIVNQHAPIVERHYGKGRMAKVLDRVQDEADSQGGLIIDTYWDERSVARLLSEIQAYGFPHLVSSFALNRSSGGGPGRVGSPALDQITGRMSEDEVVDLKLVGELAREASVMLNRWSLYRKFIGYKWYDYSNEKNTNESGSVLYMPELLKNSNFAKKVTTKLGPAFETMSTFVFRRSVEKALQLEELPDHSAVYTAESPLVTSVVEDVMYIMNIILQQSLDTGDLVLIKNILNATRRILESDFVGAMQRKLRDEAPRAVSNVSNSNSTSSSGLVSRLSTPPLIGANVKRGSGGYGLAGLSGSDEIKLRSFMIYINNLQVASDYSERIIKGIDHDSSLPFDDDATKAKELLDSLCRSFQARCDELMNDSLQVAFKQVVSTRIRNLTHSIFKNVDFMVSPKSQETAEFNGTLQPSEQFNIEWDTLMAGFTKVMAPKAYTKFISHAAVLLSKTLETRVWSLEGKVNELGAIQLDREISRIIGKVSNGRYKLREKFIRVAQIIMIIGLDDAEDEEGIQWVLTNEERRRARSIRVERRA